MIHHDFEVLSLKDQQIKTSVDYTFAFHIIIHTFIHIGFTYMCMYMMFIRLKKKKLK